MRRNWIAFAKRINVWLRKWRFCTKHPLFRGAGGETMTNKRGFITAHKTQYAVSTLCRLLKMSRGWFYGFVAGQSARDQRSFERKAREKELLPKIRAFFKASKKCYRSKRIHQDLLADGAAVSERRVARIMKENNVSPRLKKRRKPITTGSNHKMSPSKSIGTRVPLLDALHRLAG